jgi:hypothetical protein
MKVYTNEYAQKVYDIVAPLIGDVMARNSIKIQSKAIGYDEESIKQKDLPSLAEGIRKGLVIFLGHDTATKVSSKISQII